MNACAATLVLAVALQAGCDTGTLAPVPELPTCPLPSDDPTTVSLEAGRGVTLAVRSDGSIWWWGMDTYGECGGGFAPFPIPLFQGNQCATHVTVDSGIAALKPDGSVLLFNLSKWGLELPDPYFTSVADLGVIVEAELYVGSVALLNEDGEVFLAGQAGDFAYPRVFDGFERMDLPVKATHLAKGLVPCVIGEDHVAYCIEVDDQYGTPMPEGTATDLAQLKPIEIPEPISTLSVGWEQACALALSGSLYCVGPWAAPFIATRGGTFSQTSFVRIEGLPPIDELRMNEWGETTCARAGGKLWCWGINSWDQYRTDLDSQATPMLIEVFDDVVQFVVGDTHLCAMRADGQIWCRGQSSAHGVCDPGPEWDLVRFETCDLYE